MTTRIPGALGSAALALTLASAGGLAACDPRAAEAARAAEDTRPGAAPGTRYRFGDAIPLGAGRARTYVLVDERNGNRPLEVGVALSERALDSLPLPGTGRLGVHGELHDWALALPRDNGTPFQFVELDWNPGGHTPATVYTVPHFDFHFYTISKAQRDSIDPKVDPAYEAKANRLAAADLVPEHYAFPLPPGVPPVTEAVPNMGVHLVDMRSPELQGLMGNHAAHRPFTKTFIVGSWDGAVTFWEPMITRDYIVGKKGETDPARRDELVPLPRAKRYQPAGRYPDAYRITWDPAAREYRVALTALTPR